ncbi:MAG: hypothetical protein AUG51_22140 [Acidobacteria bacterium 13_1_20CM_3_53_8]|nr:MAG: hypothetical protein AUG51_22140 [Acidobacteria bacterium 13_1_20CM_3_53_8]
MKDGFGAFEKAWAVELLVARYLQSLGFSVIHRGKGNIGEHHGPTMLIAHQASFKELPVPDLEAFWGDRNKSIPTFGLPNHFLCDIKQKLTGCFYDRRARVFRSGIDRKAWDKYKKIEAATGVQTGIIHVIHEMSDSAIQNLPEEWQTCGKMFAGIYWHPILLPIDGESEKMVAWDLPGGYCSWGMKKIGMIDNLFGRRHKYQNFVITSSPPQRVP